MNKYVKLLPGVLLVVVVQLVAGHLVDYVPIFDGLTLGIILGMVVNNLLPIPEAARSGVKFTEKQVLKWGIVLLGVELNFALMGRLGGKILFLVVFMVCFGLGMSYLLSRLFRVDVKLSTLIGVGSSICGASAIAAVEPIVGPEKKDVAISAAVISVLGAAGVILYPLLGQALNMQPLSYGVWSGTSLQGVAHAVAAAFARGDASGEIGTLVKMGRVVMLAPVALALTSIFARGTGKKAKSLFPMYVLGFILVGVLATAGVLKVSYELGFMTLNLKKISKLFITSAMVAMGLGVKFNTLGKQGLRAIALGATLFTLISLTSYTLISFLAIA
ncbi:MAG: YeiH family protein [Bacillota bacterium]|jgi:uncharacterized integral membrane protein (TIGR00698 family)